MYYLQYILILLTLSFVMCEKAICDDYKLSSEAISTKSWPAHRVRGVTAGTWVSSQFIAMKDNNWNINVIRLMLIDFPIIGYGKHTSFDEEHWKTIENSLIKAQQAGMKVIIDMHDHSTFFPDDRYADESLAEWLDPKRVKRLSGLWHNIAKRFIANPYRDIIIGYEIMNEPHPPKSQAGYQAWNDIALKVTESIRDVDKYHTIVVSCADYSNPNGMKYLKPTGDKNTVYSFHMYIPHEFTEQSTRPQWSQSLIYPGEMPLGWDDKISVEVNKAWLEKQIQPVLDFQQKYNVRIWVGEFSAIRWAPKNSAYRYLEDVLDIFEKNQWDWTYHDFRSSTGWGLEFSTNRNDKTLYSTTARLELLKKYFSLNKSDYGRYK